MTTLRTFLSAAHQVVEVKLTKVAGSSPREAGACMYVSAHKMCGTIGGGQLEFMALDEARAMLRRDENNMEMDVPLGPEIGQCCGGRVKISLHLMDEAKKKRVVDAEAKTTANQPSVYIFGSGHVGRALADALALLPVHGILIDSRDEELVRASGQTEKRLTPLPEREVRAARPGSAFVVLTHDHSLDFLIASEALMRADAAYVGMIGSKTKRALFEKWHRSVDENRVSISTLVCPIGGQGSADKRPEVIAAFVAAEIIACLTTCEAGSPRELEGAINIGGCYEF